MNQKEATVGTILTVLKERGVEYEMGGDIPISDVLTDTDKSTIRDHLFGMFRSEEVTYKSEFQVKVDDDKELKKYVSGLLNNWVRKHKDFNCGQAYVIKNPGSRAHVGDDQLTALKMLSAQQDISEEGRAEITEAIVKRKAEIAASKASTAPIKVEALPESLRHLVK